MCSVPSFVLTGTLIIRKLSCCMILCAPEHKVFSLQLVISSLYLWAISNTPIMVIGFINLLRIFMTYTICSLQWQKKYIHDSMIQTVLPWLPYWYSLSCWSQDHFECYVIFLMYLSMWFSNNYFVHFPYYF